MPRQTHKSHHRALGLFLAVVIVICSGLTFALGSDVGKPIPTSTLALRVAPAAQVNPIPTALPDFTPTQVLPTLPAPAPVAIAEPVEDLVRYNGKAFRYSKTLKLRVTAYAPDPRCCWPYPGTTTASGLPVTTNGGKLVAADTKLIPLHSMVFVPGYAASDSVPVLDRGGAIKGNRLDVLMPTFEQAKVWGSRMLEVKVYLPVKG